MKKSIGYLLTGLIFLLYNFNSNAQSPEFTAHEWGTFTSLCGSDGGRLSGLYKEEEALPPFVYSIGSYTVSGRFPNLRYEPDPDKGFHQDLTLENVNVKMETPVIYFYATETFLASAKVDFKHGLISQYYPYPAHYPQLNLNFNSYFIDFGDTATHNSIEWDFKVLSAGDAIGANVQKQGETNTWTAPRATDANVIFASKNSNESEKYLFYRGVGNFDLPIKTSFNDKGYLEVANNFEETVPYFFVYDKEENGDVKVWWTGTIDAKGTQKISPVSKTLSENEFIIKLNEFQRALTKAGLFEKEAAAMLNTWKASYFGKPGVRVFWIVPRSFTNEILPISIVPEPQNLERVLVGRSEILTPDFEKKLFNIFNVYNNLNSYGNDRFIEAYIQRMNYFYAHNDEWQNVQAKLLEIDSLNIAVERVPKIEKITTFPNPVTTNFTLAIENPSTNTSLSISDLMGKNIITIAVPNTTDTYFQKDIDMSQFAKGIYIVTVITPIQKYIVKVLKQ